MSSIVLMRPNLQVFPRVNHNGKTYYAGEPGEQFVIRVNVGNYTGRREVVVAVDGRDVLHNVPANYLTQRGLVTSGDYVDIKGWRISSEEVKVFVFESLGHGGTVSEKNHGAATSRGTIAAAIFSEYRPPVYLERARGILRSAGHESFDLDQGFLSLESTRGGKSGVGPAFDTLGVPQMRGGSPSLKSAPAPSVGTAAGHTVKDRVGTTEFLRDDQSLVLVDIEYDSMANLIARGIWPNPVNKLWPGMPGNTGGFCDPRKL